MSFSEFFDVTTSSDIPTFSFQVYLKWVKDSKMEMMIIMMMIMRRMKTKTTMMVGMSLFTRYLTEEIFLSPLRVRMTSVPLDL